MRQKLGLGASFAAGDLNDAIENRFAHVLDGSFAGDDAAGVDVDDVGHAAGELGVCGELQNRGDGIAGGRAEAGGKENNVSAGADLRADAFDVAAGSALEIQAGLGGVLGIVECAGDGRGAAFLGGAGGLHGVGKQAVADVSRRRVHLEAGVDGFGAGGVVAHELHKFVGDFLPSAALDELLLDTTELWEFGEDAAAAEGGQKIGGMADGGIGGNAGEAVGAAALEAEAQLRERRGRARGLVGFHETEEGVANGFREHVEFRAHLLLLEDEQRLGKIRIAALELFDQHGHLRVLAAETQDRGAGDVGMMNVAGEEAAEISGVFAGASAAALVHQELDAVEVTKNFGSGGKALAFGKLEILELVGFAVAIETDKFGHVAAINLRKRESEFFLEGLLEDREITVLAEDERDDEPVVAGANLSIRAVVAKKGALTPRRNVGRRPTGGFRTGMEVGGGVANVASGEKVSLADGLGGGADEKTVHADFVAGVNILREEFVFGGNVREEGVGLVGKRDLVALAQRGERDENVVFRVQLEDVSLHLSISWRRGARWTETPARRYRRRHRTRIRVQFERDAESIDYRKRSLACQTARIEAGIQLNGTFAPSERLLRLFQYHDRVDRIAGIRGQPKQQPAT